MSFPNFQKDNEYLDESFDEILEWIEKALEEYINDEAFSNLTATQKKYAFFIIQIFVENCYNYGLKKPGQWDSDIVEEVCLDIFPRKISAEILCFESVAPVLVSFMRWCEYKGYLSEIEPLCEQMQGFSSDIVEKSQDQNNWGIAKSMMMGGFRNLPDDDLDYYEVGPRPILVHKIGRNELCPCGSGKKYKKCCLISTV